MIRDISCKYTVTKKQIRYTSGYIRKTHEEYESFVNAHLKAGEECIPTKLRAKHRVPWETLAVCIKRDNMKTASLCNKRNPTTANAQ